MEVRNSAAESHSSDQSQPIQETEGDDGSKMSESPVDVVGAAGGDGGVEVELGNGSGGAEMMKKKRGRPPRAQAKSPPTKMYKEEDEDVCFICFDGGSLVLCDRRGCPKAYHPACVKRDDAFFQSKNKWNCGWHICSICRKAAHHMCYTCTYSLCKGCLKRADYTCVRGDRGFCTVCMKTIMLFENNGQEKDEKARVDFDDKTSWEYLFKVYWEYLKGKLSLTLDELTQARNPCKEATTSVNNGENGVKNITSDTPLLEESESKRRKTDDYISIPLKETVITKKPGTKEIKEWATKELLEFVAHMKNGDTSMLSQFDVQELMLEYIKRNNLRDPRKKSQIICDSRLKILFGKPRVGHFEMLKLLEFHFFINEDLSKNTIKGIGRQVDPDWNIDNVVSVGKDKKRRNQKKGEEPVPQNKVDEFAAIDVHNMNLIYLRRKLMENLFGNSEEFHGKVVGSIVRIRISGSDQKHDMYRLVRVVGTSKAEAPYKIGDKSTNIVLQVLNLDKKETISMDTISNQDLSEDECRRLRQSIRCGLVKRFTVGEIQDKAVSLLSVRLNDLMEAETLRLNNLRDRASEKGHKKGLREYVEKLQRLKTPEERERRLREIPEVHSDPKMNPDYETDDTEEYSNKEHVQPMKPKHSGVNHKTANSPIKRPEFLKNGVSRSRKPEPPRHLTGDGLTKAKVAHGSSGSVRPQTQVESTTATSSSHNTPVMSTSNDSDMEKVWHYRDPNGKIQGPFCKIQLQKWSTTGYFPVDMRIWMKKEDESLLLDDVLLKEESQIPIKKVGIGIEIPIPMEPDLASPTPPENFSDSKHLSSVFDVLNADLVELPSPTPKTINEDEKVEKVVEKVGGIGIAIDVRNRDSDGGGGEVVKMGGEWIGYSPTSGGGAVAEVGGAPPWQGVRETIEFSTLAEESVSDLLAEVDAMESQNGFPSPTSRRNGFVDDLFDEEFSPTPHRSPFRPPAAAAATKWPELAIEAIPKDAIDVNSSTNAEANEEEKEVDKEAAAPSPPPPSLANRAAAEPSPSSPPPSLANRAVVAPSPPPPSLANRAVAAPSPPPPSLANRAVAAPSPPPPSLANRAVAAPSPPPPSLANSAAAEPSPSSPPPPSLANRAVTTPTPPPPPPSLSNRAVAAPTPPPLFFANRAAATPSPPPPFMANRVVAAPSPPPPFLAMRAEAMQGNFNNFGRPGQEMTNRADPYLIRSGNVGWDPHQWAYGQRERSYNFEDLGYNRNVKPSWGRQVSFGGGIGGGSGGYVRTPPKGKRVCKFYESGRCNKGASCNYWHP